MHLNSAAEPRARARLLAAQSRESGTRLNAFPVPFWGFIQMMRSYTALLVSALECPSVAPTYVGRQCVGNVEELTTHSLSCSLHPIQAWALWSQPVIWQVSLSLLGKQDPHTWDVICPETYVCSLTFGLLVALRTVTAKINSELMISISLLT